MVFEISLDQHFLIFRNLLPAPPSDKKKDFLARAHFSHLEIHYADSWDQNFVLCHTPSSLPLRELGQNHNLPTQAQVLVLNAPT